MIVGLQCSCTRDSFSFKFTASIAILLFAVAAGRRPGKLAVCCLQFLYERDYGVEDALSGFRARGLGINPQHVFGAGSAQHQPADVSQVHFDAVEIFAAGDGPIEQALEFRGGKMADGFFLLAVFHVQVHAVVIVFAEFGLQRRYEFAEALSVPGHHFGEEQRIHCRVALGQVQFGSDAPAFFAAKEDVAFQHAVADVFEANGSFPDLAVELRSDLVDHFCGGKSFCHRAFEFARAGEMPQQDRENLVRVDERAVAVHRADAVGIAIQREASVELAFDHGALQRGDVRFNRLGIYATEKRIARAANFFTGDFVAAEQVAQQSASGAVHGINHEAEFRGAQAIPINESVESFEIRRAHIERMKQVGARRERGHAFAQDFRELRFNLRDDGGRSGAAVAGFVFHAVPLIGIVAGGDLYSAGRATQFHEQGKRWRGRGFGGEPHGNAGGGDRFGGSARETIRAEARVVTYQNAGARFFRAYHVTRDRMHYYAHVLEGEIFGDDGAPAVGAKLNVVHGKPV